MEDGSTARQHLEALWRQTGKKPEALDYDDCPEELKYLWVWFLELCQARMNNGFAALPLAYAEIDAWARLYRVTLLPSEIRTIRALDRAYLETQRKNAKK